MPFLETDLADAGPREPNLIPTPEAAPDGSLIAAAARQENTLVSAYSYLSRHSGFEYDPAHNPIDVIGGTKFESNYLHNFVRSGSEAETRSIMSQIDREEEDRAILDTGGAAGVAAQIGMSLLDPTVFLPVGTIYRGVRAGRAALKSSAATGLATGAMVAGQEAVLYGAHETRTGLESTINIATGTIVGGLLGGAIGYLSSRELSQLTDVLDGFRKEVNTELVGGTPSSAGAAGTAREALTLAPVGGLERAAAPLSPVTRLQTSSFETARATVRDLGDAGLSYRENLDGIPTSEGGTVETRVKMRRGPMIETIGKMDEAYARYFFGKQDVSFFERASAGMRAGWANYTGQQGGKLTQREFRHEISKAMRRGDEHPVPEVAEAAKAFRAQVFNPLRDEAIKLGLLPENVKTLGAESYVTRVYNRERIIAERDRWTDILTRHVTGKRDGAASKFEARRADRLQLLEQELDDVSLTTELRPARISEVEGELQALRTNNPAFAAIDDQLDTLRGLKEGADEATAKTIGDEIKSIRAAQNEEYGAYVTQRNRMRDRVERLRKSEDPEKAAAAPARLAAFEQQAKADLATLRAPLDTELDLLAHARDAELAAAKSIYKQQVSGKRGAARAELKAKLETAEMKISNAHEKAVRKAEKSHAPIVRQFMKAKAAERKALQAELGEAAKTADRTAQLKELIERTRFMRGNELAEMEPGEIGTLVDEITNTILGESAFRLPGLALIQGPKGPLRKRVLDVPDQAIEEFLESDIEKVARVYTTSMSGDIELAAKFGSVDLKEQLTKLREEYNAKLRNLPAGEKGNTARVKLNKQFEAAARDVEALRDRIRGSYAMPTDPDGLMYRAGRVALNLNYLARLGGVTISSLPDFARPIMRYGLDAFRDGWLPLIRDFSTIKLAAREVRLAGTALDMVRDQRAMELADLLDDFGRNTKFERGVQWGADRFSIMNLMSPWNGAMKSMAGVITMAQVVKAAKAAAAGKATAKQIDKLAQSGIDAEMAKRIWTEAEKSGNTVNGVFLPNTVSWTDTKAVEALRAAINRETETLIVTPGLERPLWMSQPWGRIIGQFKTFAMVSTQRVTLAGLQQRDASVLAGALVGMSLGALTAQLKAGLRGEDTANWSEAQWVQEALDNSGMLGILMEANATAEKFTRGRVGLSAITGKQVSRYASRNLVGTLLGPTADFAGDLATVGALGADSWNRADTRALRKVVPLQNLFYLRQLFDKVEEGINGAVVR